MSASCSVEFSGLETVSVRRVDSVAIVTMDRPDVLNAVNGQTLTELRTVLSCLSGDRSVRAMVFTGAGRAFCAGADVTDSYYDAGPKVQSERVALGYSVARLLREAPFPTICAVQGACVAIGISFAALCDIRVASSDAKFVFGFAQVGILPDLCASTLLPGLLGPGRALELVLLDDRIGAERALQIGLVTEVVDGNGLLDRAVTLGQRLSSRSGAATRLTRESLREFGSGPFRIAADAEQQLVARLIGSRDLQEGIAAARERRTPQFTDR